MKGWHVNGELERMRSGLTNSVTQEPEGLSPHSQQPATVPYPELVEFNPYPQANLPKIHSDPILPQFLCLPSGLFPSVFPIKTLYTFLSSPMRSTCPAHLIRLDFICLLISEDEYRITLCVFQGETIDPYKISVRKSEIDRPVGRRACK
jgi:hypothetical protein